MNELRGTHQISVHPDRINLSYVSFSGRRYRPPSELIPDQFIRNQHNGIISPAARKKIYRAVDYLVYLAQPKRLPFTLKGKGLKFYLSFITLTLSSPQIHDDKEIYRHCLSPFLNSLRQKWKCRNYIWRAERQENGSIHYHIVTDRFIPWWELRNVWNRYQERLGYVSRYRQNQKLWHRSGFNYRHDAGSYWSRERQYKAYLEGLRTDWNSPNSTDIHSLRFISNVRSYMAKYLSKSDQVSDINGRLWGCSQALSDIRGGQSFCHWAIEDDLAKIKANKSIRSVSGDHYTVIFITTRDLIRLKCWEILSVWSHFLRIRFPDYHPPDLFN